MHPLISFVLATAFVSATDPESKSGSEKTLPPWRKTFNLIDKNRDEFLSEGEFVGGSLGKAADNKGKEFAAWDLDDDGKLSPEEFRKKGNTKPPPPPDPEKEFKRRDRDLDKKLSFKEFLAGRKPEGLPNGIRTFHRFDKDEDGSLTLEELANRGEGVEHTGASHFLMRDVDEDGKISLSEFLFDKKKPQAQQQARHTFQLFDYDGDGFLSRAEFELLPLAKPDSWTLFHGRDKDQDGKISRQESVLFLGPQQARWAKNTFRQFDADQDGLLNFEEYVEQEKELERRRLARNRLSAEDWLMGGIVAADVALFFCFAFFFSRSQLRKRAVAKQLKVFEEKPDSKTDQELATEDSSAVSEPCFGEDALLGSINPDSDLPMFQSLEELLPDNKSAGLFVSQANSESHPAIDAPEAETIDEFDVK